MMTAPADTSSQVLTRLAHATVRYRWPIIGLWLVLTLLGVFSAGKVSTRWFQSTAVPGQPAYEASQRPLLSLGVGARPPNVVVFHTSGDATKSSGDRTRNAAARPSLCPARSPARTSRRGA